MEIGVFCSSGRPAYAHDMRDNISPNVDRDLISDNVVLEDELMTVSGDTAKEKIDNYLNAMMQPYIDEYNKGKRSDRQIKEPYMDYWRHNNKISRGKSTPVKELVMGFGEHETLGKDYYEATDPEQKEELKKVFVQKYKEALQTFKEEHPHVKVLWATIHFDEKKGTPHMHVGMVGIGEDYKQGLSHQLSMGNALGCDGYERVASRSDKDHFQLARMYAHIREGIEQSIQQSITLQKLYDKIEIKPPAPKRGHAFKEEKAELDQERQAVQHERDAITRDKNTLSRDKENFKEQTEKQKILIQQEHDAITRDKNTLSRDKENFKEQTENIKNTLSERERDVEAREDALAKKVEEAKPVIQKADMAQDTLSQMQAQLDEIEQKKKKAKREYDYYSGKNLILKENIGKMPEYDVKMHGHGEDRQEYYFVPKLEYELLSNASQIVEDIEGREYQARQTQEHYDKLMAGAEKMNTRAREYEDQAFYTKREYEKKLENYDKEVEKRAEEIADKRVKGFISKHGLEDLWQDFKRSLSRSFHMH